jgi:hypothetical protein
LLLHQCTVLQKRAVSGRRIECPGYSSDGRCRQTLVLREASLLLLGQPTLLRKVGDAQYG